MRILLIASLALLGLQGCSQKQLYQTVQQSEASRCLKYVGPEREACEQRLNSQSYEEYKQAQKELKQQPEKESIKN